MHIYTPCLQCFSSTYSIVCVIKHRIETSVIIQKQVCLLTAFEELNYHILFVK